MSSDNQISGKLGYMLPAAHDNGLRLRALEKFKPIKLRLDEVPDGDLHTLSGFLQLFVDVINSKTRNNDTNYYQTRSLNFTWKNNLFNDDPFADPNLGIPTSLDIFQIWQSSNRFAGSSIESLRVTKVTKSRDEIEKAAQDIIIEDFGYIEPDGSIRAITSNDPYMSMTQGCKAFIAHFAPGYSGSLQNFFKKENLDHLRNRMHAILQVGLAMLPDQMIYQFRSGQSFRSFEAIKTYIYELKRCNIREPDILKLRAFIKSISSAAKGGIKIESVIANVRDFCSQFLGKSFSAIDLGEIKGESWNFSGVERYTPFINFLLFILTTANVSDREFEKIMNELARHVSVEMDEINFTHFLTNKNFIYKKLNKFNNSHKDFEMLTWERAFQVNREDPLRSYFEFTKEAKLKNLEYNKNLKINAVDISDDDTTSDDDYFELIDDDGGESQFFRFNSKFTGKFANNKKFSGRVNGPFKKFNKKGGKFEYKSKFPQKRSNFQQKSAYNHQAPKNNRGKFTNNFRKELRKKANMYKSPKVYKSQSGQSMVRESSFRQVMEYLFQSLEITSDDEEESISVEESEEAANYLIQGKRLLLTIFYFCSTAILLIYTFTLLIYKLTKNLQNTILQEKSAIDNYKHKSDDQFHDTEKIEHKETNLDCNFFALFSERIYNTITEFTDASLVLNAGIKVQLAENLEAEFLTIILDSGATRSLINEKLLDLFPEHTKRKITKKRKATGATGSSIAIEDYVVSFDIPCDKYTIKIRDAIVTKNGSWSLMLVGVTDLKVNRWSCVCNDDDTVDMALYGVPIVQMEKTVFKNLSNKFNAIFENSEENCDIYFDTGKQCITVPRILENNTEPESMFVNTSKENLDCDVINYNKIDKVSKSIENINFNKIKEVPRSGKKAETTKEKSDKNVKSDIKSRNSNETSDPKLTTKQKLWKNPDSTYTYWSKIEKMSQDFKNTYTHGDVKIDPKDEVLILDNEEDIEFKNKIMQIINDNKDLFRADVGTVEDDRYVVRGNIDIPISAKKAVSYYGKIPPSMKEALEHKLDVEVANDVLIKLPSDMSPKNIINVFVVKKRNDEGKMVLNTQFCRMVVDCSRTVNQAT